MQVGGRCTTCPTPTALHLYAHGTTTKISKMQNCNPHKHCMSKDDTVNRTDEQKRTRRLLQLVDQREFPPDYWWWLEVGTHSPTLRLPAPYLFLQLAVPDLGVPLARAVPSHGLNPQACSAPVCHQACVARTRELEASRPEWQRRGGGGARRWWPTEGGA